MKALEAVKVAALGATTVLLLALTGLTWQVSRQVKKVNLGATVDRLNVTLDKLNRPCKGSGADKADNCGTIALAGQTMVNAGDLIKLSQITEQREFSLFNQTLPPILAHVDGVTVALGQTTETLNSTATAATQTLNTATNTVAAAQPLLAKATTMVSDVNGEIKPVIANTNVLLGNANALATNPSVPIIMSNFAGITTTGNHMLLTADQVETKLAECTLHPHWTCYLKSDILFGAQVGGYFLPH